MNKLYDYLFLNKEYPFKHKWFNSFVIKSKEKIDFSDIMNELLGHVEIVVDKDNTIVCYFEDLDFAIEDVILSISDDFGISITSFKMPKLYVNEHKFLPLYNLYNKYLPNRSRFFYTSELIEEAINKDLADARALKELLLGNLLKDSINALVINGIFENDLNVLKTSKSIYMHRNTINNKINLIKKETSLNILKFKDAVVLYFLINLK